MRKNIIVLAVAIAAVLGAWFFGQKRGVRITEEWYARHTDTTTVVQADTSKHEAPIPDTVYVDMPVYYPIYVEGEPAKPQIIYRDSVHYILLDRTFKEYRTDEYYAKISGVEPSLDYIETYNKTVTNTVYVPRNVPRKRDFLELDAKFLYDGMPLAPVTANIGYRRGLFEVYAGGGYDFLQKQPVGQAGIRLRLEW